jgi:hypothetical protein
MTVLLDVDDVGTVQEDTLLEKELGVVFLHR